MGVASPGILLASFEPNIVMILEPASLRLFTASDISATEFETIAIKFSLRLRKNRNYADKRGFIIVFSRLPSLKSIILKFLFVFGEIISLLDIKAKIL